MKSKKVGNWKTLESRISRKLEEVGNQKKQAMLPKLKCHHN